MRTDHFLELVEQHHMTGVARVLKQMSREQYGGLGPRCGTVGVRTHFTGQLGEENRTGELAAQGGQQDARGVRPRLTDKVGDRIPRPAQQGQHTGSDEGGLADTGGTCHRDEGGVGDRVGDADGVPGPPVEDGRVLFAKRLEAAERACA
nr:MULTISPECIES: hypothetical protein [unclassified Streptomyces]